MDKNAVAQENTDERLKKWRLILGQDADSKGETTLASELQAMDGVLEALYASDRTGGLSDSSPQVNRWLGDIRTYFPTSVVQIMQRDALERLGLKRMLLEPELLESLQPDIHLVGTLLSLNNILPQQTRETARTVVRKVVEELEEKLRNPLLEALKGALHRSVRNRNPKLPEIDWHRTIRANLKHYQSELKTIIPEQLIGYGRKGHSLKHVILLIDQSSSMASSVVYSSVFGAVMASLRSLKTHYVVFSTSVVDLTEELNDPVDLLFGTQLGGGTDIAKALGYVQQLVQQPADTILVTITDLYEGYNESLALERYAALKTSGVQVISLLSLNDQGAPDYNRDFAAQLATLDIPSFACTPDLFADLMAAAIKREDIQAWMGRHGVVNK